MKMVWQRQQQQLEMECSSNIIETTSLSYFSSLAAGMLFLFLFPPGKIVGQKRDIKQRQKCYTNKST